MITGKCLNCKISFRKRTQKYKFCSLKCSSRFNLNGLNKVKLPRKSKDLAEFLGICLGDGNTYKYQVTISLNSIADRAYHSYVLSLINRLFPEASVSIVKRKFNMVDIKINSRIVAAFMRAMGVVPNNKYVPDWIKTNINYRKHCVKGLFDTEGSISFKVYQSKSGPRVYKQLNFRNYNPLLMKFVKDCLEELGLKPTKLPGKSLYLSNPAGISEFRRIIGFGNIKLYRRSLIDSVDEVKALAR